MAAPDVTGVQRSDLNDFLFADIGTEANGMTLSVVSVFARQGSDPWWEAGRLAELPKAEATDRLARLITGMPRSLWDLPAAAVIAVRLTGLLPARPQRGTGHVVMRLPVNRTIMMIACAALLVAFGVMLVMQSTPSSRPDGSDVGSFTVPAPAATTR